MKTRKILELGESKYVIVKYGSEINLEELLSNNISGYDDNDNSKSENSVIERFQKHI